MRRFNTGKALKGELGGGYYCCIRHIAHKIAIAKCAISNNALLFRVENHIFSNTSTPLTSEIRIRTPPMNRKFQIQKAKNTSVPLFCSATVTVTRNTHSITSTSTSANKPGEWRVCAMLRLLLHHQKRLIYNISLYIYII